MATHRGEQQASYPDDDQADAAVRSTETNNDTIAHSVSAWVVVIATEDSSISRYASWLADTYETQAIRLGEAVSPCPETDVLVVDHRTLMMTRQSASGEIAQKSGKCRVLAPANPKTCDDLIDAYISQPVSRDRLLERVETAMQLVTYNSIVSELLSLTMRRQRMQERVNTGHVDNGQDVASLSKRVSELHRHIDDELSDVESQYAVSLGQTHRPLTCQKTEDESA